MQNKKTCCWCKKLLPVTAFYNNTRTNDKRSPRCKTCDNKRVSQWSTANRDIIQHKRSERKRKILTNAKIQRGGACQICGYNKNLLALVWHHKNKRRHYVASRALLSPLRFKQEIDQCVLMCANCHTILHAEEEISKT